MHNGRQVNDSRDRAGGEAQKETAEDRGLHSVSLGLFTQHIKRWIPEPRASTGSLPPGFSELLIPEWQTEKRDCESL